MNPYAELSCESLLDTLETFPSTIDRRIYTRCLHCPPDAPEGKYCGWEFTLSDDEEATPTEE